MSNAHYLRTRVNAWRHYFLRARDPSFGPYLLILHLILLDCDGFFPHGGWFQACLWRLGTVLECWLLSGPTSNSLMDVGESFCRLMNLNGRDGG
jgi:hypothetical protein